MKWMLEKKEEFDPVIYGKLRSEFLKSLEIIPAIPDKNIEENEEEIRKKTIKEIKEGKLG